MSYQVLARKWRPRSFEELVGQRQTAQALINALDSGRLHHAYLFTGTRGVGKTTIARIFSKSVNCENGISANPCNQCSACQAIDAGNFVDLLEIDAASKTRVDDTREMLDNVQYRPTRGRYKVYLIDEVHMLSNHSFNALLKTLEEPPPHVIFLLATTDPQKLPVTVLSRCLQFHLRRMEEEEIIAHLQKVLTAEEIQFDLEALKLLARSADGSMRDALSLLDQAIVYGGGSVFGESTAQMLGAINGDYFYELTLSLAESNVKKALQLVEKAASRAPDYKKLTADWLHFLHQLAVTKALGKNSETRHQEIVQKLSGEDIQLFYQLSLQCRRDLEAAPNARQAFEMLVLRCILFKPVSLSTMSEKVKKKLTSQTENEPQGKDQKTSEVTQQNALHNEENAADLSSLSSSAGNRDSAQFSPQSDSQPGKTVTYSSRDKEQTEQSTGSGVTLKEPPVTRTPEEVKAENWYKVVDKIPAVGQAQQILLNSLANYEEDSLQIVLPSEKAILLTDNVQLALTQLLRDYFADSTLKIEFKVAALQAETPRERKDRLHREAVEKAKAELLANPQIQYMISQLECTLDEASVHIIEDQVQEVGNPTQENKR